MDAHQRIARASHDPGSCVLLRRNGSWKKRFEHAHDVLWCDGSHWHPVRLVRMVNVLRGPIHRRNIREPIRTMGTQRSVHTRCGWL